MAPLSLLACISHSSHKSQFRQFSQEWTHNSRGNWEQFNDNGTIQNRTHNSSNEVVSIDGAPITYDENGNMTGNDGNAYTWNAKNLLITANAVTFQYDALSRRIGKTDGNGAIKRFVING